MPTVTKFFKITFFPFVELYRLARKNKHEGKLLPYYAFPVLIAMLITFSLVRLGVHLFPETHLEIYDIHIHHFVDGILIQNIAFLLLIGSRKIQASERLRYIIALLFGIGSGLILDELEILLKLDGSPQAYARYYGIVAGALVLVIIIIGSSLIRTRSMLADNQS